MSIMHSYTWRIKPSSRLTDCKEMYEQKTPVEKGKLLEEVRGLVTLMIRGLLAIVKLDKHSDASLQ